MQHITKRSGGGTTFFSSFTVHKCQVSTEKSSRPITATASYTLPMMSNSVVPFGHTAVFPLKTIMETSRIFSMGHKRFQARRLAVPVNSLSKKLVRVDVSSGSYICEMPNTCEKD